METQKRTKKVLRNLINYSMRDAISSLQLPEPSNKVKKLLDRSSRKLAVVYSEILKKEEKKKRKAEKLLKAAVNGDVKKKKRQRRENVKLEEPVRI